MSIETIEDAILTRECTEVFREVVESSPELYLSEEDIERVVCGLLVHEERSRELAGLVVEFGLAMGGWLQNDRSGSGVWVDIDLIHWRGVVNDRAMFHSRLTEPDVGSNFSFLSRFLPRRHIAAWLVEFQRRDWMPVISGSAWSVLSSTTVDRWPIMLVSTVGGINEISNEW